MLKKIKENLKNNYLLLGMIVCIVPAIAIYLLNLLLKIGSYIGCLIYQYVDLSLVIIDAGTGIKTGEYIYYYFTIMAIEVTAILSWAILQASRESNQLSEAIKLKDDNRDNEKVKESAMIIYYDLLSKVNLIKNLYVNLNLNKETKTVNNIDINNDWIKNLSELRNVLSKREIDVLFELYEDFVSLRKAQACSDVEAVKSIAKRISGELFIDVLLKYIWMDFEGKIDGLLHNKYYIIFRKIEAKINEEKEYYLLKLNQIKVKQVDGNDKIHGEYVNGVLKNGTDSYYDENGNKIYSFVYKNYKVIKGEYSNYINDTFENIFNVKFDENGIENTGHIVEFYKSNIVKYRGEIKDKKYNGKGVLYQDNERVLAIFEGTWEQGKKKEGVYRDNRKKSSIMYFNGIYHNDVPYTGEIKLGNLKSFDDVYEYKGIIKNGKIENGFGYTKNSSSIDWSYIENHNDNFYCQEYSNQQYLESIEEYLCDNEYEQDGIPDEVMKEMVEEQLRHEVQLSKEYLQDKYLEVVELIGTTWTNGIPKKLEDDDLNKKYFGHGPKTE